MTNRRKKNIKKALHLKYKRLKNLKKELHYKTVNYMISNYSRIINPSFMTQDMIKKLPSKTARLINSLSYYEYKLILRRKCKEYDIDLIEKDEHYTSKTCNNCGKLNGNLGSKKIFECLGCKMIMKRDYVGARGIMLKNNNW
jgi:putative transposase